MSDAPRFSVIIPCYNAAGTVPQTLHSVAAQTCADYEVIAVDDGSTDDTAALLVDAAAQDKRIRVLTQVNGGVSRARNAGVAAARGDLIAFLDSDDVWSPKKLERHSAQFVADPDLSVAYAQIRFFSPEGAPTAVTSNRPVTGLTVRDLLAENVACTTSNVVVKRAAFQRIGPFNPALSFDEDKEWLFRAFVFGEKIAGLDVALTGYRTSPAGLASDLEHTEREWRRYVEIVRPLAPEAVAAAERHAEAIFLRNLARRALRLGVGGGKAFGLMRRAVMTGRRALLAEPRRTLLTASAAAAEAAMPRPLGRWFAAQLDSAPSKLRDVQGLRDIKEL